MNIILSKKMRLYLIATLCTILWGSAIPMIKTGFDIFNISASATADKVLFAGIRFLGAGIMLLVPYLFSSGKRELTKKLAKHSLILGVIQTAAQYFFMYIGLAYTSGVNGSVFNAVGTLLYIVLAYIIFRDERFSYLGWLGCIIGFSGILLNSIASQKIGEFSFKGDGLVILSNLCVTVGFLYSKHSVKNCNPFLLTGLQMFIGGAILLCIGLISGGGIPHITAAGILLLLYLMLVSAVAFSLWTMLLRDYDGAKVGMFNFLTPVFGVFFSVLLNSMGILNDNSALTVYTLIAVICTGCGILLCSLNRGCCL